MVSTLDTCEKTPSYPTRIHSQQNKTPLRINCNDTSRSEFYDVVSMNDISPTTAVSSKRSLSILEDSPRDQSLFTSIKCIPAKLLQFFKKGKEIEISSINTWKSKGSNKGKQSQNSSQVGKMVRHSYSDPRLSPGSTAVGDYDEERNGYFGMIPEKKKRSPRGWIAAAMMIVVGALIAITFVVVGLGKAETSTSSASQHVTNTTSVHHSSTATLSIHSDIKTTFTLKPTQT